MKTLLSILLALLIVSAQAQISSTFNTDADGWTFLDSSPLTVNHNPSNGNPGGYVSVTYSSNTTSVSESWFAPAKFLGSHLVRSFGENFRFDLQQSPAGTVSPNKGDVRIENGGVAIVFSLPVKPAVAPAWSSYTIKLDETGGWRLGSLTGAAATRTQIIHVLSNITSLEINGSYITNASNVSGIDNVVLEQKAATIAPVISSISPVTGPIGTTVTVNGFGFGATAASNKVFFGSSPATIVSGNATQLTFTIPSGQNTSPITIINTTSNLVTQSFQTFTVTFSDGGRIIPASFLPRVEIAMEPGSSNEVYGLTAADIDGDGWSDLVTIQKDIGGGGGVVLYRNLQVSNNISAASFSAPIKLPILTVQGNASFNIDFAKDLDSDGKLDLAFQFNQSSPQNGYMVTYRNISTPGNIAFEAVKLFDSPNYSDRALHIADIDGDGKSDFLGTHPNGSVAPDFFVAHNISTPSNIEFGFPVSFADAEIEAASFISTGDLNGDNKLDVIIVQGFDDRFTVLENTSVPGKISFAAPFSIDSDGAQSIVVVADLNLDGKKDLAYKQTSTPFDVIIRINSNSGGAITAADFSTEVVLAVDILETYGTLTLGDVNGDGKPDIVCTDNFDMLIFENKYSGGVFDENAFAVAHGWRASNTFSSNPNFPLVFDIDGDQKPEVVMVSDNVSSPEFISIFKNANVHAPVISVNTVSPLKGVAGSVVTITGDYFSTIPSENMVRFGGVRATVASASRTQITATVPAGIPIGLVSVTRDELTATYRLPFVPTFSSGVTFDNTHFSPPVNFTVSSGAGINVAVSDLNADGKPDVMVNNTTGSAGYAFRNTHLSGAISATSLMPDDTVGSFTRLIDLDDDASEEIVSAGTVYKNESVGAEINFNLVYNSLSNGNNRVFGDFNMDGKIDMAGTSAGINFVENWMPSPVSYTFLSGTARPFGPVITLTKPANNGATASADFDGDGLLDVAATNPTLDNVSVFRNTGAYRITPTQFAPISDITVGDNPDRLYSGDLDVDGKMDLLVIHQTTTTSQFITILHNQSTPGTISFTRVDHALGAFGSEAFISDLDGDGRPDILVSSESSDQFFILKNTSSPGVMNASSFATPFSIAINNPRGITAGDLNLDGKPEIILAAQTSLLVYENLVPSGPTITINPQPTSTAVCDGVTALFTLTATGTTNLTYQWQKFDVSIFNNISNTGGYSGATTATLSINTTGNFGAGDYRCLIKGDLAPDKFSNTVTLTVNVVPTAPTANGNSNCIPAAITLSASGGTNGQYRWYDVATGGTAIGGQINSSYVTPVISTTTTYHVAINNGLCESNRTPVIAIIAPIAKPALSPSIQALAGTINLCTGDVLTINAPAGFSNYIWSNGGNTNPITINSSTSSLTLQVVDGAGCTSPVSDALNIVVNPYPVATITPTGTQLTASAGDSYQWYQNGDVVVGATNQNFDFNFLEYGLYVVDVTDNGCTSTSLPFEYLITGFEKNIEGLKVYPNPVEENLFVEFKPPYTIQVIGVTGNVIQNFNALSIPSSLDFSSMAKGIYFLKIKNENQTQYLRIIKK